jgi:hypothetical protein
MSGTTHRTGWWTGTVNVVTGGRGWFGAGRLGAVPLTNCED